MTRGHLGSQVRDRVGLASAINPLHERLFFDDSSLHDELERGVILSDRMSKKTWKWWLGRGALALTGVGLLGGLVVYASTGWGEALGAAPDGARLKRMLASKQHVGDKFVNAVETGTMKPGDTPGVILEGLTNGAVRTPTIDIPVLSPANQLATPPASGMRVTWMGHSTLLIEVDGARILTDPVWGERASPSTLLGPARFHQPPMTLDEIGKLDAVIISHDHYDHLDMPSIKKLSEQGVHFYMPLGIGAHMERWGVPAERIHEFDWWEKTTLEEHGVELVSTPSRHFSGRAGIDTNRTLWTSWTILGPEHRIYFSGDTGYSPHFKEIGEKYGPFDLTMIEVGAYHQAWGEIHLGPHNAMQAHLDLGGEKMLPVHWGTFDLALHSWTQPARVLAEEAPGKQIQLVTPRVGEPVEPSTTTEFWWEALGRE